MRSRSRLLVGFGFGLGLVLVSSSCGHDFEPPDRAARVRAAEARYSAAAFDTVQWSGDQARVSEGNAVYAETCRRCHGPLGRGGTDYARERGLTVPSLVEPDWPLSSPEALRHTIYVGHEAGMPIFGDGTLDPRRIDAVAAYILETLRPDVLGRD